MDIADRKQGEIRMIIKTTIEDLRPQLLTKSANYEFIGKTAHGRNMLL